MTFTTKTGRRKTPSTVPTVQDDLVIPDQPNEPSNDLTSYSWCIYGEKGIGKTSLAAEFPDVVAHFMWEPARRDTRSPIIPQRGEPPLTWPRMKGYLQKLLTDRQPGRIIVDTLDLCARACQKYHAALVGVESLNGIKDNGRAWDTMKCDWENTWSELLWGNWRLTLLSHARVRPKVVRGISRDNMKAALDDGVVIPETQPTASGWAYEWSKSVCSFAAYMGWHGRDRILRIRGDEQLYASSGGVADLHFLQKKGVEGAGKPYDYLPLGDSPKTAYRTLLDGWNNKAEGVFLTTETYYHVESD